VADNDDKFAWEPGTVCPISFDEIETRRGEQAFGLLGNPPSLVPGPLGMNPPSAVDVCGISHRARLFDVDEPPPSTAPRLSGANWVNKFPTSNSVDDLSGIFKTDVQNFLAAIKAAGGSVTISATYRPPERAYLMHYAWEIANKKISPKKVPPMNGVNIQWDHGNDAESIRAAKEMVQGYHMRHWATLTSKHTERAAIDMTISSIIGKTIKNRKGDNVLIRNLSDLNAVGASYGVYKLVSDPPHWSDNGH